MAETDVDLVILGGGSGGYACALRAAELGMSVALIDKDKLGGTCLHRGCIPTKALLHAGEVADLARESEQFGVKASLEGIDAAAVRKYQEGVVGRLYKGLQGLVKSRGVQFVEGEGRLASSSSGTRCGSISTTVTSAPKDRQMLANSTPMTPPPRTTTEAGTRSSCSAWSL